MIDISIIFIIQASFVSVKRKEKNRIHLKIINWRKGEKKQVFFFYLDYEGSVLFYILVFKSLFIKVKKDH